MKQNLWQMSNSYLCTREDLEKDKDWSLIGLGSEKKWYCISEDSPQGIWDGIAERMLVEFAESGCPIFLATSPLSRGQLNSKGHGKLSIHYAADLETFETFFSHHCFCKPAQSLRSSRRDMWRVRIPSWENLETPLCWDNQVPHSCSVWSRQKFLWIVMTHRIKMFYSNNMVNELKSCHNNTH